MGGYLGFKTPTMTGFPALSPSTGVGRATGYESGLWLRSHDLEWIGRDEDGTAPCLGLQPARALGESPNIRTASLRSYLLTFIFKNNFISSITRALSRPHWHRVRPSFSRFSLALHRIFHVPL